MPLTLEQRKAIAAKAVATRRANLAAAGIQPKAEKPKKSAAEKAPIANASTLADEAADALKVIAARNFAALSKLEKLATVRYYDEGWRYARLVEAGLNLTRLQTIPAFSRRPTEFEFHTHAITPATA